MNKYAAIFTVCLAIGVFAATQDEARAQLDKLADVATASSQNALKELNRVADGVRQLSQSVLASGSRLVDQEETRLLREVQNIIDSANRVQVNISSCLVSKQGVLRELADITALEVVTCVDRFTNQATTAVSQGLGRLNGILTDVFTLRNKLEACKPTDATCINTIVTQIVFEENDIPRRIQEELDLATNKAEANRLYLSECGLREAESLVRHGGDLVSEIQRCVDLLIEGSTRPPF